MSENTPLWKAGSADSSMKCPTKVCSSAVHRVSEWQSTEHNEYAEAECPQCRARYWLIKRDSKYSLQYRPVGDESPFTDNRKGPR